MTEADEWRELLEQANDVPGRILVRPGAGARLRARVRRRTRQRTAAALAGAFLLIAGAGLAATMDGMSGARAIFGQPAGPSPGPAPDVSVGDLRAPIELHMVGQTGACPMDGGVPAWDGSECYRLGPLQMRILAVSRATFTLHSGSPSPAEATVGDPAGITIGLTQADSAAFAGISEAHTGQRLAVVVGNRVLSAPQIAERIDSGVLLIPGPQLMIDWAAARLRP